MGFGLSFGKKKQSSTTDSTINKVESGTQSGLTGTTQNTSAQSSTSQQGTQSSQTSGTSATENQGTNTSQQQQTTQNYSDETLGGLESVVQRLLGSGSLGNAPQTSDFNKAGFVASGDAAARARAQTGLDESMNGIIDAIGGRNNSAAVLLQNRAQNDTNAALAGTHAQLTGQAEEIQRQNLLAGNTIAATSNDLVTNLLYVLRGGISSTTGQTAEQSAQKQVTQTAGTENQQTQQSSQTQTAEQMTSLVQQLIQSLTNTNATELTKTKGKSGGGGLSLSL